MPSRSLNRWRRDRVAALDEIERAHRGIGGVGRGRRYATQQINQAYAVLISSQFQGFCRDLHSETADYLTSSITPPSLQVVVLTALTTNRKIDQGNPNPGNLGADFGRLGIEFWNDVRRADVRNASRQAALETLNQWRNAIAHQDFTSSRLGGRSTIALQEVRAWRNSVHQLATQFDCVVYNHIASVTGLAPW